MGQTEQLLALVTSFKPPVVGVSGLVPACRYAWECQTQEGGWGLDGVLREHSWKLQGIVNGMDYSEWSPEHDAHLRDDGYCNYGLDTLARGKAQCKEALQRVREGCRVLIAGCLPSVERGLPNSPCRLLAFSACGPGFGLAHPNLAVP